MSTDMNELTLLFGHWLKKNGVPTDGVRLVVEFPSYDAAARAEMAIKREIEPHLAHYVTGGQFRKIERMNGIGLTLRVALGQHEDKK